jgi:hypothetical protein
VGRSPRDRSKLQDSSAFLSQQPPNFKIALEHLDLDTERDLAGNAKRAIQYIETRCGLQRLDGARFEAIKTLWQGCVDSFNQRRVYEWGVCIPVWTAFAGGSALLLSEKILLTGWQFVFLVVIGLTLGYAHLCWLRGLFLRNNRDRNAACKWRKQMEGSVGFWDSRNERRRQERLPAMRSMREIWNDARVARSRALRRAFRRLALRWWVLTDWNHRGQAKITVLLYVTLLACGCHSLSRKGRGRAD